MSAPGDRITGVGHFMDGQSARVRPLTVIMSFAQQASDHVLLLRDEEEIVARWSIASLRQKKDQARSDTLILKSTSQPDARLVIEDPELIRAIETAAPDLLKADVARGTLSRIALWAGGAIAAVLLIVFVIVPALSDQLATLVPEESEKKLGEASINQISWVLGKFGEEELEFCDAKDGAKALDKMVARLTPQFETEYELSVRVLDHPMENAFAVPGGHVILFKGLIDRATSAEEIAGVLGHELGHVVYRDPTRLALRSAGTVGILGMLVGDFTGGAMVLVLTERLIAANYAQDAEAAADQFAYQVMGDAGLPTAPFGNFFDRMAELVGDSEGLMSHLASHPNLSARADAARAADRFGDGDFEPVLSDEEWAALQSICDNPD